MNTRPLAVSMDPWTFPPEFAELVWSNGSKVERQIDATGKKWVRFAVWNSVGNGAIT